MANVQYIGARYVPKIFTNPDDGSANWKSGIEYEWLTIVTENGDSYTSKTAVPAGIGAPSLNPAYWVLTGNFNASLVALRNRVENLELQNGSEDLTTVAQTLSGAINELNDKSKTGVVTPEMFGATADGVTDDSQAWQDALDSGKIVIAVGTYKIHNVSVTSGNVIILGNGAKIYPFINANNIEDKCLLFEDCDNAIVEGIEFTNPSPVELIDYSLYRNSAITFDNCKNAVLKNCYFHDNSKATVGVNADVLLRDGVGYTFRDCDFVSMIGCRIANKAWDEAGFISYYDKEMTDIHATIEDCIIDNWSTSSAFNIFADTISFVNNTSTDSCDCEHSLANFICNHFNGENCTFHGHFEDVLDFSEANWYKAKSINISKCDFVSNAVTTSSHRAMRLMADQINIEDCYFYNYGMRINNALTPAMYQTAFRDYYRVLTIEDFAVVKGCRFINTLENTYSDSCVCKYEKGGTVQILDSYFDMGLVKGYAPADVRDNSLTFSNNVVKNIKGSPIGSGDTPTFAFIAMAVDILTNTVIASDNDLDDTVQFVSYLSKGYKNIVIRNNGKTIPSFTNIAGVYAYSATFDTECFDRAYIKFNCVEYHGAYDKALVESVRPLGAVHKGDVIATTTGLLLVTADGAFSSGSIIDNLSPSTYVTYELDGVQYKALEGGTVSSPVAPASPVVGNVYTIGGVRFLCIALQAATSITIS